MGDLPKWKECEVQSHYNGWPTQMEDRKNVKWSRYNGWPTQMEDGGLIVMGDLPRKNDVFSKKNGLIVTGDLPKDRMWLTWQKDLVGAVLTGQGWETWHLLVAGWLEDSLMTRLISLFLWDSPTGRVQSFSSRSRILTDSFIINSMILSLSTTLLDFIEDLSVTNHKYVQCFEARWHACILTWCEI